MLMEHIYEVQIFWREIPPGLNVAFVSYKLLPMYQVRIRVQQLANLFPSGSPMAKLSWQLTDPKQNLRSTSRIQIQTTCLLSRCNVVRSSVGSLTACFPLKSKCFHKVSHAFIKVLPSFNIAKEETSSSKAILSSIIQYLLPCLPKAASPNSSIILLNNQSGTYLRLRRFLIINQRTFSCSTVVLLHFKHSTINSKRKRQLFFPSNFGRGGPCVKFYTTSNRHSWMRLPAKERERKHQPLPRNSN